MRLRIIQPEARFSCGSCGACCDQPWRTMIEADRAEALRKHDFSGYPQLVGKAFFGRPADGRPGFFDLAKGQGNRCLFLDADGLCIIHKELGPAAKPGMCGQFPLIASRTWTDERVTLNFACPSVQANQGARLTEEPAEITRLIPPCEKPVDAGVRVPLDGAATLALEQSEALLNRIHGFFEDGDTIQRAFGRALEAVATVSPSSGNPTPQISTPAKAPLAVRMLLAATLQPDTVPAGLSGRLGLMGRMAMIPKLMALASFSGAYPSRILGRNVRIDEVMSRPLHGDLDDASSVLLRRYVRSRIWSRTLAGTRLSILAGLHQHILDLCAVTFFARASALDAGAHELSHAHIKSGLQAVEFHLSNQDRVYDQILRGWFRSQLNQVSVARASLQLWFVMSGQGAAAPEGLAMGAGKTANS